MYWSATFAGVRSLLDEVEKAVSEVVGPQPDIVEAVLLLADNAIMHSLSGDEGGKYEIQITSGLDFWQIRIDDGGTMVSHPERRPQEPGVTHGLDRLEEIASTWGVIGDDRRRAVWAEFWHKKPTS